jgi:fatty acid amide hydrolase 2
MVGIVSFFQNIINKLMNYFRRNSLYGVTNNPYDLSRTVGGSSGGAGCIVSAAGVPFAVGSDIGGSIRLPSFMNGIFGHKTTPGKFR